MLLLLRELIALKKNYVDDQKWLQLRLREYLTFMILLDY